MPSELSGIVVVDKPQGITSAGVVARVKALFGAAKVGHAGTLDPIATGVLVCCLNRATRLSRFMLASDKTYEAELVLGVATDTQDATGTPVGRYPLTGIDEGRIREVAARFVGPLDQVPPVYSALKHQGVPLYKLARRGEAVEKPARPVRIHRLQILDVDLPRVRMQVACSAGTYIRTLCADMGSELGCGGHLAELRRIACCGFGLDAALALETLADYRAQGRLAESVIPMNAALPFMPAIVADAALAGKIRHGVKLVDADFNERPQASENEPFKILNRQGHLLAVVARSKAPDSYNYCCVFSV